MVFSTTGLIFQLLLFLLLCPSGLLAGDSYVERDYLVTVSRGDRTQNFKIAGSIRMTVFRTMVV
jgi:hypothetical protein